MFERNILPSASGLKDFVQALNCNVDVGHLKLCSLELGCRNVDILAQNTARCQDADDNLKQISCAEGQPERQPQMA